MAVLVGIDEAGYGPMLGPLVITAAGFTLPDNLLKVDMWKTLATAVGKQKKGLSGKLLITDSKKAYTRSSGISHLRRSVLACLQASGPVPDNLHDLLNTICPECLQRLNIYPWYQDLPQAKLAADPADIRIAANALTSALTDNQMSILPMATKCLDTAYFNKMVDAVKNKANVSFTAICQLINTYYQTYPKDNLQFIIDRQGGRVNYVPSLSRMFPQMELKVLAQGPKLSSYELSTNSGAMKIHFMIKADLNCLPVALASMTSKYLRELLMDQINEHFAGLCPGIKPTAGYVQDGRRFIKELHEMTPEIKYEKQMLIRSR